MCGITGYLNFDSGKPANSSVIKKMTDTILYRGPDAEGYYVKNNLAFGHRRLSIIDLSTGDQPMLSDDKNIILVFNGEIYNYIEIREELIKLGHIFHTNSDTEVIIKSYQQWGTDCQCKFNGMWAFALWDENKQQLFLSRDRIGEKPLYYSIYENSLIFGSEIKCITAYGVPKIPDMELLEIFLSLSYIPSPYTFFKNILKLKPGHCLTIRNGMVTENKYWDLPEIDEGNMISDKRTIYEQFENLLVDSVRIRMRSDVPYGAFLSGGLDSCSIVALMSEISSFPVETFTIGFKERYFDERHEAKKLATKFHTNHHELVVEPTTFYDSLNRIAFHYDEPFGDSSAIPTGHVSKFAASKVKMVLTGDGGDEVLSGYTAYQGEKFSELYRKLPGCLKENIPDIVSFLSGPLTGSVRYKLNRVKKVCHSSGLSFIDRYLTKALFIDESNLKRITAGLKVYPIKDFLSDYEAKCNYRDPFYKLMYFNMKLSLPDEMLVKVDRMSMAYSLETRTPFLDHRLVEFLAHVHKDIKMNRFERKTILRNTVGRKLPQSILSASKKGFGVPLREWFKDKSFEGKLEALISAIPGMNGNTIHEIFRLNQNGKEDYGNFIWMLFVLQKVIEESDNQKL